MKKTTRQKICIPNQSEIMDQSLVKKESINEELSKMRQELFTLHSAKESVCPLNSSSAKISRKSDKFETSKFTEKLTRNKLGLRKVLQEQKVNNLVRNFLIKLKRNVSNSAPIEFQPFNRADKQVGFLGFLDLLGFRTPVWLDILQSIVNILLLLVTFFIYPISIIFSDEFALENQFQWLQIVCILYYTYEIVINFISIKTVDGRSLIKYKDIFLDYFKRKFPLDLMIVIILIIDVSIQSKQTAYLRLFVLVKAKECLQKIDKLQTIFVNNFYKEQYWALGKVFIINFIFAHCLAVLLISMSNIDQTNNWLTKINIQYRPWYEQYAWAYYWGSTIMLTVGFGDIAASNYKEAICITFIQTFSCILLAYNINCVGNLISNIKQQDTEKNKYFKVMRRLVEESKIENRDLVQKLCNFIDESDKMKKKLGFEDQKQFISNLPSELKADFLKESNIKIFQNLRFFSSFSEKTLLTLAELIEVKIAHPQQIIIKSEGKTEFVILRSGEVGYCTKKNGSQFNDIPVDIIKLDRQKPSVVLDLNFLNFIHTEFKFEVKSIKYSMIYRIGLYQFIQIIKNSAFDFENFCQAKDKSKHIIDQFETVPCSTCPTKHTKMKCPKLHFIPIHQHTIYKYLEQVRQGLCERSWIERAESKYEIGTLKLRKYFKKMEEQIYKGSCRKQMKKQNTPINEQTVDDGQYSREGTARQTKNNIRATLEENKLIAKIEKGVIEKFFKLIEEKQNNTIQNCWEMDQLDVAHNFKFYYLPFNSCDMELQFKMISSKDLQSATDMLSALKTMKASQCTQKFL